MSLCQTKQVSPSLAPVSPKNAYEGTVTYIKDKSTSGNANVVDHIHAVKEAVHIIPWDGILI